MQIRIKKRNGELEPLDITKIQKVTIPATENLSGVSQSELELDAQIQFVDGMSSVDINNALIKTAVDKTDIDVPNWTFVASRIFLYDLYHRVGISTNGRKGKPYSHLSKYLEVCKKAEKMIPSLGDGFDLEKLNNAIKPERDMLFNYLGIKTLYDRYLLKDRENNPIELPQHMFMGVAMFLAQNESDKNEKAIQFYDVISKFEVMLATPTLSNARTNRHQLSSCYIGSSPDNIEGIFHGYEEMALLSKYGGGIGWDWNEIRALGGYIDNTKGAAGGTVPFLKINNDIAIAVDQLGTRKGAIAVYLEPSHLDILDFIDLKKNSGEERRRAHDLFPALWIDDAFMEAVLKDSDWNLYDPAEPGVVKQTLKAKDLWKKILTSYFESGSPFLCFKDTANRANPNSHVGKIRSSNLCTEIFQNTSPNQYKIKVWVNEGKEYILFDEEEDVELLTGSIKKAKKVTSLDKLADCRYTTNLGNTSDSQLLLADIYCVEKEKINGETAVCNLASVNLSKINTKEDIERVIPIAVRILDNVIDLNYYPLKKVKDTNLSTRAIGLGVMGEAQMLAESQIMFGSSNHFEKIDYVMECISYNAILSSSNIAIEKGAYPKFNGSNWSQGIMPFDHANEMASCLTSVCPGMRGIYNWEQLRQKVKKDGMRNGYLMAIAPTSSISILVGTTQAIEPVYKRKWFEENLSGLIPVVVPNMNNETYQYYVTAFEVDQLNVVRAAAIRQNWIDQGQSTNIFMSLDKASGKYLHEIYTLAWKLGLKSTYYLRSQSPEAKNDIADRSMECSGCQ